MNYYEILEVSQNASKEVIKAAYKSLIQRYHPDKNPDNVEIAERASLVVQAFEILSNVDQRAVYDLQLKELSISPIGNTLGGDSDVNIPGAYIRRKTAKESKFYWYLWFLIILIVFSGWVILSLKKNKQAPETELRGIRNSIAGNQLTPGQLQDKLMRMDAILKEHPEIHKKEAIAQASEEATRIIPIFITHLTVRLKVPGKPLEDNSKLLDEPAKALDGIGKEREPEPDKETLDRVRVLSIPLLGVKVGSFDAEKVLDYMDRKQELISQNLAKKLVYARYEDLIKIQGEQYLKNLILDSIGETTGTSRFEDFPPSKSETPGRYGVVDVMLPESFSVR